MKIKINVFVFNPFQENTYVLSDNTNEAIIIDPGSFESFEKKKLRDYIEQNELKIKAIYNTHCHIDHVLGNDFCKEYFKAPLLIPEKEEQIYRAVKTYADSYGIVGFREAEVDQFIDENHIIQFGNTELKSMWIPGHAPGHLVFYNEDENVCIGGDVLFQGSIGRTDLPGGNHAALISNIRQKLFNLHDDMKVFPGHGPVTTIGEEKKYNPFVGIHA